MAIRLRIAVTLTLAFGLASYPAWGYHVAAEVHLPGDEGWDYLTADAHGNRLYVSHGTHVEVLDARTLKPVGSVANTPGVHGIALAEDLGRGYVSAGASGSVVVFDLKSLSRLTELKTTGDNPDAILYAPTTHRLFTFNGRGRNVTAFDARTNKVLGTLVLDAKPEFAVADAVGQIYVNLEDRNSIAKLDPTGLKVLSIWPLDGCDEPSGLAIDRAHERLFAVCSNKVMDVMDAKSGRVVAQLPIGEGVDGAGFDAGLQMAFASGGDGTLTVVKEETPQKFSVVESIKTRNGARTMTVEPESHRVFLSAGERRPAPEAAPGQPRARPVVIPDTFEVLVVEP